MRRLRGNSLLSVFVFLTLILTVAVLFAALQVADPRHPSSAIVDQTKSTPLFFMPDVLYPTNGADSSSLAVADLNHDGYLDVVTANSDDRVSVFLGNGDGTFQSAVIYPSGGFTAMSVAIADFNGDGIPDLLVANRYANGYTSPLTMLLGNGDGTFQPAIIVPSCVGCSAVKIAAADVNGDGKADLIAAFSNPPWLIVELGNGDATFGAQWLTGAGSGELSSVAVADVDLDGKLDVLVTNHYCGTACTSEHGSVAVFLGHGDGTFQDPVTYDAGGNYTNDLAVADLNGDGIPDVAVANLGSGVLGIMLGNGDGTLRPAVSRNPGVVPSSVGIADVNRDGKPDLLAGGGALALLLGNGDGTFGAAVTYDAAGGTLAVGDVNHDHKPDVLTAGVYMMGMLLNNSGAPPTNISLVSTVNPANIKQLVTYTATVTSQSGNAINGTVTFKDGGSTIGTVPLSNNRASQGAAYANNQVGTHQITASYSGELRVVKGSRSAILDEYVRSAVSKTVVTSSGSPTFVGQPVTFTAIVTSKFDPIPDGEAVTFYDGNKVLGSVALASGTAVYATSSLSGMTHYIYAKYPGDRTFEPSAGLVQQVVLKYATKMTLASSPNPSAYGQAVIFTATVTASGPHTLTGWVRFWDGPTVIGTTKVGGGVVTLNKSTLATGTHAITAKYLSDGYNAKSSSNEVDQVVQ